MRRKRFPVYANTSQFLVFGAVILFIAMLDEWVLELRGLRRAAGPDQPLHNE